jgi:hypothetical protein
MAGCSETRTANKARAKDAKTAPPRHAADRVDLDMMFGLLSRKDERFIPATMRWCVYIRIQTAKHAQKTGDKGA